MSKATAPKARVSRRVRGKSAGITVSTRRRRSKAEDRLDGTTAMKALKESAERIPYQKARRALIRRAIERMWREEILKAANAGYAVTKSDPVVWQEELEERAAWKTTSSDGLTNADLKTPQDRTDVKSFSA